MIIKKIVTEKRDIDIDIKGITLLSKEEYRESQDIIPSRPFRWWLRTPVENTDDWNDIVHAIGVSSKRQSHSKLGVSPALIVELPVGLERGDKVEVAGYTWTVLSSTLIHCDEVIAEMAFRKNWKDTDCNVYEKSDVKKYLEEWYKNNF